MRRPHFLEVVGVVGFLVASVYYVQKIGWLGLIYCILCFALGFMIMFWFGDLFPIIGPLTRWWDDRQSKKNSGRDGQ